MKAKPESVPVHIDLRVALLYALFGVLWISFSDRLLAAFIADTHRLTVLQTYKGWAFVALSAVVIFSLLRREFSLRKVVERGLRESEEHYRLIAQNAEDMIWTMNMEFQLTYVSPAVERALGCSAQEILSSPSERFLTPESYAVGLNVYREEVENAKSRFDPNYARVLELEYRRKDGSTFWVEMKFSLFRDPNGQPTGVLGVGRDITERKRDRQQLEILKYSIDTAVDGAYWMDKEGHFLYVNDAGCKDLGYSREELLNMNVKDINPLVTNEVWSETWQYLKKNKNYTSESIHRRKDGSEFPVEITSTYVQFGEREYCNGFAKDITQRKQAEEEMRSRSRQLSALLDASQSLTESLNQAEVLQKIADKAADVLTVETTAIYLVEGEHLFLGASTPPLPAELPETTRMARLEDHPHISQALLTQQSVVVADSASATLTEAERSIKDALGLGTIAYFPLVARQAMVGILILGTVGTSREFSKNEMDVARALSNQAALAIGNTKLYEDLSIYVKELESQIGERKRAEEQIQRQLKYLSGLRMIDIAISSSFDLNIILDVVLQQVLSQLGVDAGAVLLFNSDLQMTEYAASRGFRSDLVPHTRLKLGEGYAGQAVLNRKTIHISALTEKGNKLTKALALANEEFVDYYGAPLIAKGEVKGVLEIYHRSYLKTDTEWLEFLEALAGQAAIAIDNAQLFENLQRSNQNLEQRVIDRTAELNQINAELERANRIKDEFLANMSHELRTPLTSILGLSESLREQRRGSLNDHQEKSLEIIETSGRHLLELINDILDLSKIEAGKFDYYPQPISVDDICRSSLTFIKTMAAKKSINVTYQPDHSIAKIFADPRRLKQILVNLLSNAVKFTLERGEVVLQVNTDLEQDVIKFSVIDSGIGIAAQDLRRLFQPFVQVDSGLNRQHEGTGLGLALVQKLTDLHGGSVQVDSEVGKGSRFTVNLPCLQEEVRNLERLESPSGSPIVEKSEKPVVPAEAPACTGVILLADDNMPSILTIGEYLQSRGYEVVAAHDGVEALKKAEDVHPDLILMDVQMPVMNGLEAIARLRANVRFVETPIIALTALAMPGDRERSLLAGATEYMSKPVSLQRLVGMIEELRHRPEGFDSEETA